jgi:hypothetical protein
MAGKEAGDETLYVRGAPGQLTWFLAIMSTREQRQGQPYTCASHTARLAAHWGAKLSRADFSTRLSCSL